MPEYLLTCQCGRQTTVSTAQAGAALSCACGQALLVPTLRELRELPVADSANAPRRALATWDDRQRQGFLLGVAALACLMLGGYFWWQLPAPPHRPDPAEIDAMFAHSTPLEVVQVYHVLKRGLDDTPPEWDGSIAALRRLLFWKMGIALALGGMGLIAAVWLVLLRTPRPTAKLRSQGDAP